jgi:hypothetical protein
VTQRIVYSHRAAAWERTAESAEPLLIAFDVVMTAPAAGSGTGERPFLATEEKHEDVAADPIGVGHCPDD